MATSSQLERGMDVTNWKSDQSKTPRVKCKVRLFGHCSISHQSYQGLPFAAPYRLHERQRQSYEPRPKPPRSLSAMVVPNDQPRTSSDSSPHRGRESCMDLASRQRGKRQSKPSDVEQLYPIHVHLPILTTVNAQHSCWAHASTHVLIEGTVGRMNIN